MFFGLSKKNSNRLESATESVFKALFSQIPGLNVAFAAWDGYQSTRHAEFIEELSEKIKLIDQSKIDFDYIKSEEFFDIFQKCHKIRMQNRSKLKARFIVNLIAESVHTDRDPRFNTDIKEMFLFLLDEMSDSEQIYLSEFANGKYRDKSRNDVYQSEDSKAVALDALYTKGILKDGDTWQKPIGLSMIGREFIEYIKLLGNMP